MLVAIVAVAERWAEVAAPGTSGGRFRGRTAAESKDPIEVTCDFVANADVFLLRVPPLIPRDPSTPHRATFARRGAPLRMTTVEDAFQQIGRRASRTFHRVDFCGPKTQHKPAQGNAPRTFS